MKSKWLLRQTGVNINALSKKLGASEAVVAIMANRGIKSEDEMKKFLRASKGDLYDPFLMKDMDKGTDMVLDSILNYEKIVVYGDYDADGVTSTTILYKALKRCGANVSYYIPDRESEGYGMCSERVEKLARAGVSLIITCDNGISAMEQVSLAKELGMKVVVTDHHELPFKEENGERIHMIPPADAVINPKQKDCNYPFKLLCGAGISLKFAQALYAKRGLNPYEAHEFMEIAGIGTICDIVDLVDENRIIAKNALSMLKNSQNIGIQALKEVLQIKNEVSSYHVGFQIGPCINATGRLDSASLSVDLLLCEDMRIAREMALNLDRLNKERQAMTQKNVEEIIDFIENSEYRNDRVLVVYKEDVHESIAGIVAGKVRERYNVPTIILTRAKEEGTAKGSGRSIEEYNLFEELMKCKELMERFGGHPMAAGLSLKVENIDALRKKLNENCTLSEDDVIPKIRIDKVLKLDQVSIGFVQDLKALEPFGKGNSSPCFAEKNVEVLKVSFLGKDKSVLKLSLRIDAVGRRIDAVGFSKAGDFNDMMIETYGNRADAMIQNPSGLKLDLIFYPAINEFNGFVSSQLRILDLRISAAK